MAQITRILSSVLYLLAMTTSVPSHAKELNWVQGFAGCYNALSNLGPNSVETSTFLFPENQSPDDRPPVEKLAKEFKQSVHVPGIKGGKKGIFITTLDSAIFVPFEGNDGYLRADDPNARTQLIRVDQDESPTFYLDLYQSPCKACLGGMYSSVGVWSFPLEGRSVTKVTGSVGYDQNFKGQFRKVLIEKISTMMANRTSYSEMVAKHNRGPMLVDERGRPHMLSPPPPVQAYEQALNTCKNDLRSLDRADVSEILSAVGVEYARFESLSSDSKPVVKPNKPTNRAY